MVGNLPAELNVYAGLMDEIKIRTAAAMRMAERNHVSKPPNPDSFADYESFVLQVRYICEAVALAAITAHYHADLSQKIRKGYDPGRIFELLSQLNSYCFPRAVVMVASDRGKGFVFPAGMMKLDELKKVYAECGNILHKGNISRMFEPAPKKDMSPVYWLKRINELLDYHAIIIPDQKKVLHVRMNGPNGKTWVEVSEATGQMEQIDMEQIRPF